MNSRERLKAALNHRQPDRIPLDLGSTGVTGMHCASVATLREYYGLERRPVRVWEPLQLLGIIDEDLKQALGVDVEGVLGRCTIFGFPNVDWKPWRTQAGQEVLVSKHFNTSLDAEGNTYIYPEGDTSVAPSGKMPKGGWYFDAIVRQAPIDDDRLDPADNLEEFGPIAEADLAYYQEEAQRACLSERGVIGPGPGTALGDIALVPGLSLKGPRGIRDIEEWYVSTVSRRPYIKEVFERQTEIAVKNLEKLRERVGDSYDVVYICGTDFGTQSSTFCSPASFRDLYLPYYRKVNDWIHRRTSWKTFKHSCGAVESLIEVLIEAGFDILNPVQCSAAGMAPEKLKAKYGDRLVFWGGGVDTQKTLPFGSPAEVREEVLRRCEVFGRDGGFVFNTIHNVQPQTPVANMVAMFEALKEFNGGK